MAKAKKHINKKIHIDGIEQKQPDAVEIDEKD